MLDVFSLTLNSNLIPLSDCETPEVKVKSERTPGLKSWLIVIRINVNVGLVLLVWW